jgi:hypothetical protein
MPHRTQSALGLRPARRGRGSRAVVVRFMPVKVDEQGRADNLMTMAGKMFSDFEFLFFGSGSKLQKGCVP